MDKNVVWAVFLFLIVVDASNAKFRKLAAAPQENKSISTTVLGENKPDPKPIDAATEQGNVQVQNNPSLLGLKPDLVSSPPQKQITDNRINLNSRNLVSLLPVQNQIMNDDDSLKGLKNTGGGKNLKNSSSADLTMSNPDGGKVPKHVNATDLLSPSPLNEKDNGKSGGKETDNGKQDLLSPPTAKEKDNGKSGGKEADSRKTPKPVNGTDFLSPSPGNEKDNESRGNKTNSGKTRKHVNGTDLLSPSLVNEKDNGKSGENEMDNGKTPKHVTGTDLLSPPINEKDNGKNGGTEEESTDYKRSSELVVNETCDGLPKCTDLSALIACIQNFDTGSREFTVLVQNDGEKTLIVNLLVPTAVENPLKLLKLSKRQAQKINISLSVVENNKLILNTENGECVLHTDHSESENIFVYLPSYDKLVTPINGAYFLILSVLAFGGTWAYCKCRKRRWHEGVPYQELEMGLPESVPATSVETAEGWDQGWDDDWDEDNAVKSPATRMGSISANGLTSRSPNRDGWEQDWDD